MFGRAREPRIETDRLFLRPPRHSDYRAWAAARADSRDFLKPWEPRWAEDHLTRRAFRHRVHWSGRAVKTERAYPFFIFEKATGAFLGAVTLDNIRRGPAQSGTVGYWISVKAARRGYMREALTALTGYAFDTLGLGRIEAGCLPENTASRGVLEKSGFKYEGVAQAYLQIDGRWRDHVLYASLRRDRRGRAG
ncbi:MAG: GNAT family protein [Pseudomonadota bacterium]